MHLDSGQRQLQAFFLSPQVVLTGILLLAIALRVLYWSPSADGDEARYINHAVALAHGELPKYFDGAVAVRVPYLLLLAVWGHIFGISTISFQAANIVLSCALLTVVWSLAKRLFDVPTAHVAAILVALLPTDILMSTHALTDSFALLAAFGALSSYWKLKDTTESRRNIYAFCCGLLMGVAVGARQPYVLLLPIFAVIHALDANRPRITYVSTCMFVLGGFTYLVMEGALFWLWLGDPMFRFTQDSWVVKSQPVEAASRQFPQNLLVFRGYFSRLMPPSGYGLLPLLLPIALVDAIGRARRAQIPIVIWCLAFTIYFFWGTVSLSRWVIPPINARYLLPVFVTGSLLVADLMMRIHRQYRFAVSTSIVAGVMLLTVTLWTLTYHSRTNVTTEFIASIATAPSLRGRTTVIPESVMRFFLPVDYWHYTERMRVVPDEQLAAIESFAVKNNVAFAVPNEGFYRYAKIGVMDAFERTKNDWEVMTVYGRKWPGFMQITGKPSDRVLGFVFTPKVPRKISNKDDPPHGKTSL